MFKRDQAETLCLFCSTMQYHPSGKNTDILPFEMYCITIFKHPKLNNAERKEVVMISELAVEQKQGVT